MDELRMIATLLDETPSDGAAAAGRARLTAEIVAGTPGSATHARRRLVLGGSGLAAAAVATAVVVLASGGTHRASRPPKAAPRPGRPAHR